MNVAVGLLPLPAIPFLHPGLAGAAVLAGAVPIIIHLINRRRYRRLDWAAMRFVETAQRRSVRRIRLQHWLLMLFRVAVVMLLGLAIARPYVPASAMVPLRSSRSQRIVLLDNGLSMNARNAAGPSRFEVAREWAQQLISTIPAADAVSMAAVARPADAVIARPEFDRRIVRDHLARMEVTQRPADIVGALDAAGRMLHDADVPAGNRTVYLISDFPRRLWQGDRRDAPTPAVVAARRLIDRLRSEGGELRLVRVAPDSGENIAVGRLAVEDPLVATHFPVRITAEVANFGAAPARGLQLQFQRDGQIVRTQVLEPIDPGQFATAVATVEFATGGTHVVEARVITPGNDVLEFDNGRYRALEVREAIPVLLVDGRPGRTLLTGAAGFLATALSPRVDLRTEREFVRRGPGAKVAPTPFSPKVVSVPELDAEAWPAYDVIALCNVQRLSEEQWQRLGQFVERGGGVFIFAGDGLLATNYNRYGYAEGAGLIPGRVGRPAQAGDPGGQAGGAVSLVIEDPTHPIVAGFTDHPESGLFLAQVDRHLTLDVDTPRAEVLAGFTDGDPALVAAQYGQGTVLWSGTSADMSWSNLPAKGDYVSLMLNAVAFLSRRHGELRNLEVGDKLEEPLTPAQSSWSLSVATAEGGVVDGRVEPRGDALSLVYGPVERAGVLRVGIGPVERRFAVNVDAASCDVQCLDAASLRATLDRPVTVVEGSTAHVASALAPKANELAQAGLYAVLLLLLAELWLAVWFGRDRSSA